MPRERFLNLPPDARARLLRIALAHFAERGFEAGSLNEILAAAGISKGAYYYYFDDKEDLFATALEAEVDAVLGRRPLPSFEDLAPAEFWPAVEACITDWAAYIEPSSELFRALLHVDEALRRSPRFASVLAKGDALYRALIEAGRRLGCVRADLPVEDLVRVVQATDLALDSILLARHPSPSRSVIDTHARLVFDTCKRLLAANPPADPRRATRGRRSDG